MDDPRDVILEPVVSEKSYGLMDVGVYTFIVHPDANRVEIIFVDIADDPDIRKIGDSEGIRRSQSLNACRVRNLLIGDHARDGREDVNNARRMVLVHAQYSKLCGCRPQVLGRILLRRLRDLERALGDCALLKEYLGAIQLHLRQPLVVHRLQIQLVSPGHVTALNSQQ